MTYLLTSLNYLNMEALTAPVASDIAMQIRTGLDCCRKFSDPGFAEAVLEIWTTNKEHAESILTLLSPTYQEQLTLLISTADADIKPDTYECVGGGKSNCDDPDMQAVLDLSAAEADAEIRRIVHACEYGNEDNSDMIRALELSATEAEAAEDDCDMRLAFVLSAAEADLAAADLAAALW